MSYQLLFVLLGLQIKHLILDFMWQPPFEWQNKGTYGHPGGIQHSVKQALGTYFVLLLTGVSLPVMILFTVSDGLIHYHVDWLKMNFNKANSYTPSDEKFWHMLGFDQFAHQITYIMIALLIR